MAQEIGSRVGALLSIKEGKANLFGYGVYKGDESCPMLGGMKNPKIELDNGTIVWGCECWWGPEDVVKAKIKDLEIVHYKIIRDSDGKATGAEVVTIQ